MFLRQITRSYSGNKVILCTRQSRWESQYIQIPYSTLIARVSSALSLLYRDEAISIATECCGKDKTLHTFDSGFGRGRGLGTGAADLDEDAPFPSLRAIISSLSLRERGISSRTTRNNSGEDGGLGPFSAIALRCPTLSRYFTMRMRRACACACVLSHNWYHGV